MEKYESFALLKKISFERPGGSKEEEKVANILLDECKKLNVDAHLEEFEVDGYEIKKASLLANNKEYEVTGVGMSGETIRDGITGQLVIIESDDKIATFDSLKGKIALVFSRMMYKTYKLLCEKNCSGFICCSGSIYDELDKTDLEKMSLRERHYKHGKIPGVCMRLKDVESLLKENVKEVTLTLLQSECKKISHNVVATIKGTSKKNEIVCFTAHYDSVAFSQGAYDNATGSLTILQALDYFKKHRAKRTLKFIWCGSEEMGLLGSTNYVKVHEEELKDYKLCINVDMTGVLIGKDIACCTSEKALVDYINYMGNEVGFNIKASQGVYSSDSTPFADKGVPSISFARISAKGGMEIHSRKDVVDFIDENTFYKTCEFINMFANRMINSVNFPVNKVIPEEMKKELDIYLGRKEREV
ncbi:MAG: M28 family metallopeptidase [Erysipelotrichaceae bacterium]|nr:M28 family metallopeptidase [Erysipelotrichaceae bacterium]